MGWVTRPKRRGELHGYDRLICCFYLKPNLNILRTQSWARELCNGKVNAIIDEDHSNEKGLVCNRAIINLSRVSRTEFWNRHSAPTEIAACNAIVAHVKRLAYLQAVEAKIHFFMDRHRN
jgi:hypothetical protein